MNIKPKSKKNAGFGAAPTVTKFRRSTLTTGEDLPALKRISKEIKGQNISLEDFILLVGPHTGDKGATLTKVMNEDLSAFRRMVIKIYDTMTKDASDVMANTQIELGQLYSEKQRILVDNMIRSLQIIKDYVPDFDFHRYFQDPEQYINTLFKLAEAPDNEEVEAARRQLAYHRLQWLQSEGERLQAENTKLEQRLSELKKIKRKQITESILKEQEAEKKREQLEQKQEEMQNELEELCDELHEAIVTEEKKTMNVKKEKSVKILAKKSKTTTSESRPSSYQRREQQWNVKVATEFNKAKLINETKATSEANVSQKRKVASKTKIKKPKKPVPIHARPAWQDVKLDESEAGAGHMEESVPIDILNVGTSRAARPPRAAPPPRAVPPPRAPPATGSPSRVASPTRAPPATGSPSRVASSTRAPPSTGSPPAASTCPPECSGSPSRRVRAPEFQQPAPRGRRISGPRDTWGGFG